MTATFTSKITHFLGVNRIGAGSGTVSSVPTGIDCGEQCLNNFAEGSTMTLTATPAADSKFGSWGGACVSFKNQPTCTLQMTKDMTVQAKFQTLPKVPLTLTFDGTGSVKIDPPGTSCTTYCQTSYVRNTEVTLTATPQANWYFFGWTGDGCIGTATCTIKMDRKREISAVFKPVTQYLLKISGVKTNTGTVTSADGAISCQPTCTARYAEGTEVTLTATPAAGYEPVVWGGACEYSNDSPTCTFRMTQNQSVNARFVKTRKHTLTIHIKAGQGKVVSIAPDDGISCRPSCVQFYDHGTTVVLQANPATGYKLDHWNLGCTGSGICYLTISTDRIVEAYFAVKQ